MLRVKRCIKICMKKMHFDRHRFYRVLKMSYFGFVAQHSSLLEYYLLFLMYPRSRSNQKSFHMIKSTI